MEKLRTKILKGLSNVGKRLNACGSGAIKSTEDWKKVSRL